MANQQDEPNFLALNRELQLITADIPRLEADDLSGYIVSPMIHADVRASLLDSQSALKCSTTRETIEVIKPKTVLMIKQWLVGRNGTRIFEADENGRPFWVPKLGPLVDYFPLDQWTCCTILEEPPLTLLTGLAGLDFDQIIIVAASTAQITARATHMVNILDAEVPVVSLYLARMNYNPARFGLSHILLAVPIEVSEAVYDSVKEAVGYSKIVTVGFDVEIAALPDTQMVKESVDSMRTVYTGTVKEVARLIMTKGIHESQKFLSALFLTCPQLQKLFSDHFKLVPILGHQFEQGVAVEMARPTGIDEGKEFLVIVAFVIDRGYTGQVDHCEQVDKRMASLCASAMQPAFKVPGPIYARWKLVPFSMSPFDALGLGLVLSRDKSGAYNPGAVQGEYMTGTDHVQFYGCDTIYGDVINQYQLVYANKNKTGIFIAVQHLAILLLSGLMSDPAFSKAVRNIEKYAELIKQTPFAGLVKEIPKHFTTAENAPAIYYAVQALRIREAKQGGAVKHMDNYDVKGLQQKIGPILSATIELVSGVEVKDATCESAAIAYSAKSYETVQSRLNLLTPQEAGAISQELLATHPNCSWSQQYKHREIQEKTLAVVTANKAGYDRKVEELYRVLQDAVNEGHIDRGIGQETRGRINQLRDALREAIQMIEDKSNDRDYLSANAAGYPGTTALVKALNDMSTLTTAVYDIIANGRNRAQAEPMAE